jgi:hypothetical protein
MHGAPSLEPRDFEVLAASLRAIGAVLLCRDACPGTVRQLDRLEKAIDWERQRLAEANAKAQLRQRADEATAVRLGLQASKSPNLDGGSGGM